jgi:hypothetical protein
MCNLGLLHGFHVDNIGGKQRLKQSANGFESVSEFFSEVETSFDGHIAVDPKCLLQTAKDTLLYLESSKSGREPVTNPTVFKNIVSLHKVKETLRFIISTIQEDEVTGHYRVQDPDFWNKNFGCVQWTADWQDAVKHNVKIPHDGRIRLTTYCIFSIKGSHKKTAKYPCGLYRLLDNSIRKKYTKHQILAGVLEKPENKKKRKALAWVSRQDLEDAIMHGTVVVNFADGAKTILNVDSHNGIAYNRKQKNILAQERYWFFRELKASSKAGSRALDRFKKRKNVVFAGDLYHIGVGKLIALQHINPITKKTELRVGLLADTGGAFKNNLYQLDLFGGVFNNKAELRSHLRALPTATNAFILYKL